MEKKERIHTLYTIDLIAMDIKISGLFDNELIPNKNIGGYNECE